MHNVSAYSDGVQGIELLKLSFLVCKNGSSYINVKTKSLFHHILMFWVSYMSKNSKRIELNLQQPTTILIQQSQYFNKCKPNPLLYIHSPVVLAEQCVM